MAPQRNFEFVVLKLSYKPKINPQFPQIFVTRKGHSPNGKMNNVHDFFQRVINREKSKIPSHLKIRFCDWNINSGNANLFTIYGYRFENILLVLGEETIHWLYYHNQSPRRRLEGSCPLINNFCSCCLNTQYLKIIETVNTYILNLGKSK